MEQSRADPAGAQESEKRGAAEVLAASVTSEREFSSVSMLPPIVESPSFHLEATLSKKLAHMGAQLAVEQWAQVL